jgi:hypothetical protein
LLRNHGALISTRYSHLLPSLDVEAVRCSLFLEIEEKRKSVNLKASRQRRKKERKKRKKEVEKQRKKSKGDERAALLHVKLVQRGSSQQYE